MGSIETKGPRTGTAYHRILFGFKSSKSLRWLNILIKIGTNQFWWAPNLNPTIKILKVRILLKTVFEKLKDYLPIASMTVIILKVLNVLSNCVSVSVTCKSNNLNKALTTL